MMSDIHEKDSTRSLAWMALDKETQEKLIGLRVDRLSGNHSDHQKDVLAFRLQEEIHSALGTKNADVGHLNDDLKNIVGTSYDSGIYGVIRSYLERFEAIESAVLSIAQNRLKGQSSEMSI